MTPARTPGWRDALDALRDAVARRPFAWGEWDCARWGAAAVEAQTGVDFYAPFAGRYSTEIGAARALRRIGGGDLAHVFTAALGEPSHPAFAANGDIVMAKDGMVGVVAPNAADAEFVGEAGLVRRPRADWVMCWRLAHG